MNRNITLKEFMLFKTSFNNLLNENILLMKMSKTIIYIRHGPDRRGSHKYDEKLTSFGKEEVQKFTLQLIEQYGLPDVIYYSPFYRTRQTRKQMMKAIKQYRKMNGIGDERIELILEPRLGRFFTRKQRRNPDIKSSTFAKGAIIDETKEEFRNRIQLQFEEMMREDEYSVIWNITHTLVLLHIARLKGIERDPHVNYLDTVVVTSID